MSSCLWQLLREGLESGRDSFSLRENPDFSPLSRRLLAGARLGSCTSGTAFRKPRPVGVSLLCNLLTNPAANVLMALLLHWLGPGVYVPALLCLELAIAGIEAFLYRWLLGWPWKKAVLCSVGANALSWAAGLLWL